MGMIDHARWNCLFFFFQAVAETTAELCVAGTRKTPTHSSSTHRLGVGSAAGPAARRSNSHTPNRIQVSTDHPFFDTHLPSIRDTNSYIERDHQSQDEFRFYSRSKTNLAETSPKSTGRPPTASFSSIFNSLSKRSTENFTSPHLDVEETIIPTQVPPSRRSQRPNRGATSQRNLSKHTMPTHKPSGDSGVDIRLSTSSGDTNQQQRVVGLSSRLRSNAPQVHLEYAAPQETGTKERVIPGNVLHRFCSICWWRLLIGQLYQRRSNNAAKAPVKQKINKFRRRSEEVTQAINGDPSLYPFNNGLSAATPNILPTPSKHLMPIPLSSAAVRRASSDAEIQARLEALRLSMETNYVQTEHPHPSSSRHRSKSPYQYTTHQQLGSSTGPVSPLQTPPTNLRRNNRPAQAISPSSSQNRHTSTNQRRVPSQTPPQHKKSAKQPANNSPGNLYLAFIASRHLSALEDTVFECDIDHQKLLRMFTWLKGVEDHRHQQPDHEHLLDEQNQRMLEEDDNFSLYSEIQYAVDDVPANTNGKVGEKIAPMQFDN